MFKLSFKTDNDSFRNYDGTLSAARVADHLHDMANSLRHGSGKVYDANGNAIGTWSLTDGSSRKRSTKRNPPKRRKSARRTTRRPARSRR